LHALVPSNIGCHQSHNYQPIKDTQIESMKTENTSRLKTLIDKTPRWIKIGMVLILPSPIVGLVAIGWGINRLLKSKTSNTNEENRNERE